MYCLGLSHTDNFLSSRRALRSSAGLLTTQTELGPQGARLAEKNWGFKADIEKTVHFIITENLEV